MNALDKEEFRIKLEEINRLVEKKNYKDAMEVVDSIDWRRVKNVRTLCVVGEIYAANKRYEDSKEIFLLAYHRAPIGKNILYRLIEVSLKMKDISEAEEFYEEFLEVAPNDNTRYILKYKICKEKQVSLDEQIRILEEYKEKEFTERWSYELAKLYYQNGDTEKCLDLCNEMVLWFSEGKYVMKALDLKNRMGMLTGKEKEKTEAEVWYQGHEPCMKGAYEETDLAGIFPAKISSALVDGMEDFNKKIRGFSHPLSILSGVESRTSSPVRIVRDNHSLESVIGGLYPCGEGAGYAGGITSAAADGIKIAEKIRQKYAPFL